MLSCFGLKAKKDHFTWTF